MKLFLKQFRKWFMVKSRLDRSDHILPSFNEREIWWCSVGENIGVEMCGKGTHFRRPMLIIKKLDRYSFVGIPITKSNRHGSWYKKITIRETQNTVVLSQPRHMDYRRIENYMHTIGEAEFDHVMKSFLILYKLK